MTFKKDGLTLRVLDKKKEPESPDFSVGYAAGKSNMVKSHEILSLLIGKSDFILVIDSDLLVIPSNDREVIALNFLESIKKKGIDFRYKKGKSTAGTIFGLIRTKEQDSHRVAAFIPNSIWVKGEMDDTLNPFGCRFYVVEEGQDQTIILNALQAGETEEEMDKYFRMTVFDCPATGYMGIYAKKSGTDEMRELLGI